MTTKDTPHLRAALEPCPFCGGEATWREYDDTHPDQPFGVVVSHTDSCFLSFSANREDWSAAWNTRATDGAEIARLKTEIAEYRKRDLEQRSRLIKLAGALEAQPPISLDAGSWFYPEDDTSSDECRFSPGEVIDYAVEGMADGEARVVVIQRALMLPDSYAAVRVLTDEQKDARGDDEDVTFTLHRTAEDARQALASTEAPVSGEGM